MKTDTLNVHGQKIKMISDSDLVVAALNSEKKWENHTLKLWLEKLQETNGTILDVGAYTGIYGILAASAYPNRTVMAFEPLPQVFERLRANRDANDLNNLVVVNLALSDDNGEDVINITNPIPLPSGSSFHPSKVVKDTAKITKICGDTFLNERIGLVKIDTEHHEEHVLRGMWNILEEDKPVCIIEILYKDKLKNIVELMRDIGYDKIHHINDMQGTLIPIDEDTDIDELNVSSGMNFIFESER